MYNSINHFVEFGVKKLEKNITNFLSEGKDIADLVIDMQENLFELGRNILQEVLEDIDKSIKSSGVRKKHWNVIESNSKSLMTSFGKIEYSRTYFKSKKTNLRKYLVDDIVGIETHDRVTSDVVINSINEAIESSYRKGGEKSSFVDEISKQSVMNKIHRIEIIEPEVEIKPKRKCKTIFIEADEDHVSLQQKNHKNKLYEDRYKRNTHISKLVYVHEGIDYDKSTSKRRVLKNIRYFSHENNSEELWLKVAKYISNVYEEDCIEKVYLSGDGAGWIKEGLNWIAKSKYVLDNYHQNKYFKVCTAHLVEEEILISNLRLALNYAQKELMIKTIDEIISKTESETKVNAIKDSKRYFLNNWNGIKIKFEDKNNIIGCSAEGHISHVLSARLSSRPMGWSKHGAIQINKLRVYSKNGGKIYDLVMNQKKKNRKEIEYYNKDKMIREIRKSRSEYEDIVNKDIFVIESGRKTGLYKSIRSLQKLVG